jgi:MATE family multidrug resistance protein
LIRHRAVLALAWPIVLSQASSALPGLVDTAAMGRAGTPTQLAAVALAAMTFSFVYWGFGFLRMATTAQTAQARGAGDPREARAVLWRALLLAGCIGMGLIVLFPLLQGVSLWAFGAEAAVEREAAGYLRARILGAPAALAGYAINGWLLGSGRTRALLGYQLVLNGSNAALDTLFVVGLGWGAAGIGAGTALAEALSCLVGLWMVRDGLRSPAGLWQPDRLTAMFRANRDIMVRTLALLGSFAWFLNTGALMGATTLAANQVLMQLVALSAFVLDAFAFVAEKEVGEAVGADDRVRLRQAISVTSQLAVVGGLAFSGVYLLAGEALVGLFTDDPGVRAAAHAVLPFCALVPALGVPAFQLDGIFLGATRGRVLRRAAVVSAALYVGLDLLLRPYGNPGAWTALLAMYVLRALTLAVALPALLAQPSSAQPSSEPDRQTSS